MTNTDANNAVVAIYKSHSEAEAAVKELQCTNWNEHQVRLGRLRRFCKAMEVAILGCHFRRAAGDL